MNELERIALERIAREAVKDFFEATENAEKYAAAIVMLYDKLDMDIASVGNDMEHDYLTENTGRSGRNIIWYLDETKEAAIYTDSYEFLTKKQIEKELM